SEDRPRRVALARGRMLEVSRAVFALVLPRVERREVREDRARPGVANAVLGLERRDLVDRRAVLGPWLDLTRDEVDAELGQALAHGRRERAPLGLVQGDHSASS